MATRSIGVSQLKGCRSRSDISVMSRSLRLLAGNFSARMWSIQGHTHSARFAEIWIASLAPTFLVGYQIASRRRTASQVLGARRSPFAVVRPRPVLPPGDRPPLLRADGNGAGSDGHGHLNRQVWEAQSLSGWRFAAGEPPNPEPTLLPRAKRLSAIPITVGYQLHGER